MNNDGFSFSVSLGQSTPAANAPRYIARPYEAHPMGEQALLLAAGDQEAHRVPLFYAQALSRCDHFKTLAEHTEQLLQDFGIPVAQKPAVLQGLQGLADRGLLQSEQRVLEQLGEKEVESGDDQVETLCIRSCGRPTELSTDMRRCLLERRALMAKEIGQTLGELDPPNWLRSDFERLLESQAELTARDSKNLPQLAHQLRSFGRNYGSAMDSWLRCWHSAAHQSLDPILELSR